MFSKKVQEFDDLKHDSDQGKVSMGQVKLKCENLADFKQKFDRESSQNEDLSHSYYKVNEALEAKGAEYKNKVDEIIEEKLVLIQENKEVKK